MVNGERREILSTAWRVPGGLRHVIYPSARVTACGIDRWRLALVREGGPAPTCPECLAWAAHVERVDGSIPPWWTSAVREYRRAQRAARRAERAAALSPEEAPSWS